MPNIAPVPVGLGAKRTALDTGGFALTEARYSANQVLPPHAHANPVLVFIVAGSVREQLGSTSETHGPISLLAIPAGALHGETFPAERACCLIIEANSSQAAAIRAYSSILDRRCHLTGTDIARIAIQLRRELQWADSVAALAIDGLVWQLSALAERRRPDRQESREPGWLRQVRDAIHSSLDRPIRIAELARIGGVHPVYLARAFQRHHQCSPANYVRRVRIDAAATQLRASGTTLAEVALAHGFSDQSHFSKVFRIVMGTSPGAFRRLAGGSVKATNRVG
jgi:AraC family transcriptional regulator